MAAVFFGALGHETHVRYRAHRFRVEGAVLLAEIDRGFVDAGVATVRNTGLYFLQFAFLVPHATGVADHCGHRGIDDDVARNVQVGDSLGGIDHGEIRARSECGVNGGLDFSFLSITFQALVQVTETVVRIDSEFLEQVGVFREHVLEEYANECTE